MIDIPIWTPEPIRALIRELEKKQPIPPSHDILGRLATDPRMKRVWNELLRHDRTSDKNYFHSALRQGDDRPHRDEGAQHEALKFLFWSVLSFARDQMGALKLEDIEDYEAALLQDATRLRTIAETVRSAIVTGQFGFTNEQSILLAYSDSDALDRVAAWHEHRSTMLPQADDILVVANHGKDPIARGIIILIQDELFRVFGASLERTAATLASVALGRKTKRSAKGSNFSRKNTHKSQTTTLPG